MKIYLSCHHPDPANDLAAKLTAAGHTVVSTWHTSTEPRPAANDTAKWAANAKRNFSEIYGADALLLIASPQHISREKCVPGGKFVEAGYAIGVQTPVYIVGGVENGMLYSAGCIPCKDADELLAALPDSCTD